MKFQETLREGIFLKRYKRFFVDVQIDGNVVVAHVPNTGSLKSCLFAGAPCVVSDSVNPERKLKATLHFLKTPTSWVGVNTSLPNQIVHEAWAQKKIPAWQPYAIAKREYKISQESRLDLVLAPNAEDLEKGRNLHHIEVKNVTYAEGKTALFPDAVTTRGQKHLQELMALKRQGNGAELVFVIQRQDCTHFAPADHIDPTYGKLLRQAKAEGVTITAYTTEIDPKSGITLSIKTLAQTF